MKKLILILTAYFSITANASNYTCKFDSWGPNSLNFRNDLGEPILAFDIHDSGETGDAFFTDEEMNVMALFNITPRIKNNKKSIRTRILIKNLTSGVTFSSSNTIELPLRDPNDTSVYKSIRSSVNFSLLREGKLKDLSLSILCRRWN